MNPDVLTIAAELDHERAAGQVRGPLHGIPFLVKDNIASKDKMETTAGSWALQGSIVPRDSFVVSQLRKAGAVLMGKATLSEWADMRSNNYSEGYSGRGGQARSAYNFTVNPGGSSSGSAIAVSNNVVTFSLGTETDGSLINPAERNAIVAIKPTVGLTSRAGVIPESTHQDTVGAFGRTLKDAVYALDAIYGVDPRDNYTSAQVGKTPAGGYIQFMSNSSALKGATFGLPWKSFWALADPEQQGILLELVDLIKKAGATVINGTELPDYETIVSPDGWNWFVPITYRDTVRPETNYLSGITAPPEATPTNPNIPTSRLTSTTTSRNTCPSLKTPRSAPLPTSSPTTTTTTAPKAVPQASALPSAPAKMASSPRSLPAAS
jgi:amidase